MTKLTAEQYDFLTRPIAASRVQRLNGRVHVEAWDVRRHLIRIFGFDGFDIETKALDLVAERLHTHDGAGQPIPPYKPRWTVVYRAEVRLTLKVDGEPVAVFEDGASGDSQNQPSLGDAHDMAMKTALSQALKRCAVNLGDQFGLSLYNDGRTDAVVARSLVAPAVAARPVVPVDDAPVLPEPTAPEEPAEEAPAGSNPMVDEQRRAVFALMAELGYGGEGNRDKHLEIINYYVTDRAVTSRGDLSRDEADRVIVGLRGLAAARRLRQPVSV
jgi:hypothetical protein